MVGKATMGGYATEDIYLYRSLADAAATALATYLIPLSTCFLRFRSWPPPDQLRQVETEDLTASAGLTSATPLAIRFLRPSALPAVAAAAVKSPCFELG
jgi:hypothetical protein